MRHFSVTCFQLRDFLVLCIVVAGFCGITDAVRCADDGCLSYNNASRKTASRNSRIDIVVENGQDIDLPCNLPNPDSVEMLWRHQSPTGRKFIVSFTSKSTVPKHINLLSNFTLQFHSTTLEDIGFYACTVRSRPAMTLFYHLNILASPSLTTEPDSGSITVEEGDSAKLGCFPKGNPTPTVTWKKDYGSNSNVTLPEAEFLHFRSVISTDTDSPELSIPVRIIYGGPNYSATLKCLVASDPLSEVHWSLEEKMVIDSNRVYSNGRGSAYTLHFTNVRDSDFGIYVCGARNSIGSAVGYIELSGLPKPPVVIQWVTSACDKNNDRKSQTKKGCKCRECRPSRNVTCRVHVTLEWVVESYSSLIDYRLMLRHGKRRSKTNSYNKTNEGKVMAWTELFIPANTEDGPLYSKQFTLHSLKSGRTYEVALTARNKYGNSLLSHIYHITPEPRSLHTVNSILEVFKDTRKRSDLQGGLEDTDKNVFREFSMNSDSERSNNCNGRQKSCLLNILLILLILFIQNHTYLRSR